MTVSVALWLIPSTGDRLRVALSAMCVLSHYFWHTLIRFYVFRIWFSTTVATDVSITFVLLWQFYQIKSSFKSTNRCISCYCYGWPPLTRLDLMLLNIHMLFSLIHRLMASTIRTGTITSVVSVLIFILFLIDRHNNGELIWKHCLRVTELSFWLQRQLGLWYALAGPMLLPCSTTWITEVHSDMDQHMLMEPTT